MERQVKETPQNNQKIKHLISKLENGFQPVITWVHDDITEQESYDVGMNCRVIGINELIKDIGSDGKEIIVYELQTDFSEFEERNLHLQKVAWFDFDSSKTGSFSNTPTLKWSQTPNYPKDKKVTVYVQASYSIDQVSTAYMFEFVTDRSQKIYAQYQKECPGIPYVQWLEQCLENKLEKVNETTNQN